MRNRKSTGEHKDTGINYMKMVTQKWEHRMITNQKKQCNTQTDSVGEQVHYAGEHTQ